MRGEKQLRSIAHNDKIFGFMVADLERNNIEYKKWFYAEGQSAYVYEDGPLYNKETGRQDCSPDLGQWINENCFAGWHCLSTGPNVIIAFEDEDEAFMFKIVWG